MDIEERPYIVMLGTAGGPRWWRYGAGQPRAGIATAVVVGGAVYLVDCGYGAGRQLVQAGLDLSGLRAVFLTHLHSDHTADLGTLATYGLYELDGRADDPVRLIGPGNRGVLPPVSPRAAGRPEPVSPDLPTPGTREMFDRLIAAHATDLNDRVLDSLRPGPHDLIHASDIVIPAGSGFHPNDNPTPEMRPFSIYQDDRVAVSAILVEHPPMAPAFGFRFDTEHGSVTFSGDTAYTANMVTLAEGTDLLVHEAIDFGWVDARLQDSSGAETSRASRNHHYKSHTSPLDAAKVADEAGASALALHHFVPGDTPVTVWQEAGHAYAGRLYVPDDLDHIPLRTDRR